MTISVFKFPYAIHFPPLPTTYIYMACFPYEFAYTFKFIICIFEQDAPIPSKSPAIGRIQIGKISDLPIVCKVPKNLLPCFISFSSVLIIRYRSFSRFNWTKIKIHFRTIHVSKYYWRIN